MAEKKPMKMLCLHGYRQSGQGFRTKTGAIRKVIKKRCEYVWVDAPHKIPDSEDLGWWFSQGQTYDACASTKEDNGFGESLDSIAKVFSEEGPFDGILSFSQGACFAAILCCLKESGDARFQNFNFAIIAAGYRSRTEQHQQFFKDVKVSFPTLHIIGETDQVIAREMSDELATYFAEEKTTIVRHPDGHIIPTKGEPKAAILKFLDEQRA